MATPTGSALMERLVSLCKRRGFIFQSSEIYGGINGFWDYGPLGVELKNNLRDTWWDAMVHHPPEGPAGRPVDIVGLDCSIISHPRVWEASGHLAGFADPMQTCRHCKRLFRADHVAELLDESEWVAALRSVLESRVSNVGRSCSSSVIPAIRPGSRTMARPAASFRPLVSAQRFSSARLGM